MEDQRVKKLTESLESCFRDLQVPSPEEQERFHDRVEELRRLTNAMMADGHRVFSFTYHSPSLEPGHTPYVRDNAELDRFLGCFGRYFDYFMHELGGRPATPGEIKDKLAA